ncbi:MAG TPA: DUF4260 domain-containing protein, partial [Tepidisphaeraceae bacterium]
MDAGNEVGFHLKDGNMPDAIGSVNGNVRGWLRIEGLAVFGFALVSYLHAGHRWWLLLVLFLAPDVSFAAYAFGPRVGGAIYNLFHTYIVPLVIGCGLGLMGRSVAVPLIWVAHIGFDRFMGYGLKYP